MRIGTVEVFLKLEWLVFNFLKSLVHVKVIISKVCEDDVFLDVLLGLAEKKDLR